MYLKFINKIIIFFLENLFIGFLNIFFMYDVGKEKNNNKKIKYIFFLFVVMVIDVMKLLWVVFVIY